MRPNSLSSRNFMQPMRGFSKHLVGPNLFPFGGGEGRFEDIFLDLGVPTILFPSGYQWFSLNTLIVFLKFSCNHQAVPNSTTLYPKILSFKLPYSRQKVRPALHQESGPKFNPNAAFLLVQKLKSALQALHQELRLNQKKPFQSAQSYS